MCLCSVQIRRTFNFAGSLHPVVMISWDNVETTFYFAFAGISSLHTCQSEIATPLTLSLICPDG